MRIRPKENYHLLGTQAKMSKEKTYLAEPAFNQPEYEEKGKVFAYVECNGGEVGFLLENGEYTIVS